MARVIGYLDALVGVPAGADGVGVQIEGRHRRFANSSGFVRKFDAFFIRDQMIVMRSNVKEVPRHVGIFHRAPSCRNNN